MMSISRLMRHVAFLLLAVLVCVSLPQQAIAQAGASTNAGSAESLTNQDVQDINPLEILGRAGEALGIGQNRAGGGEAVVGGSIGESRSGGGSGGERAGGLAGPINILVVLTIITLVPSVMLMCTCFVRIVIVLGLLKQALGTQTLPPPQVIVGLAMFMTILVMSPTIDRINREAIAPYRAGQITSYDELWVKGKQPLREFMLDQIEATGNWSSLYMILNYRGIDTSRPELLTSSDVDMVTLVPAFMLSELKTGFLIGFKVYLPFLVIDIVISSLLISMGMMMLPPVLISLPFKLLLFVLVDGWMLIVGSLMQSFVTRPSAVAPAAQSMLPGLPEWATVLHSCGPPPSLTPFMYVLT